MFSLVCGLAPLVCGALLAVTGAGKLFGRRLTEQAAGTVLVRLLGDARRAATALRTVGGLELAVAAGVLAAPGAVVSGMATAVLGAGFTAYLGYAKATAPESSCGCTARSEGPIGGRAFTRAGLVVVLGLVMLAADGPWWAPLQERPVVSAAVLVVAAGVLLALSDSVDRLWLLPLRRARLKVFGHPLTGADAEVPVAATVELLERSMAWVAAAPLVRSSLIDHWDEDGWRILRFTGVHTPDSGGDGDRSAVGASGDGGTARPVDVLFALDTAATLDNSPRPAVRVTVVDVATDEVVPVALEVPERKLLPLAEPVQAA